MPEESLEERYVDIQYNLGPLREAETSMRMNGLGGWKDSPRHPMRLRIIEDMVAEFERIPKTRVPILICTAGPSGIRKGASLRNVLQMLNNGEGGDLGQPLNKLVGNPKNCVTGDSFVVLSHQRVKEDIWRRGGLDFIPEVYREKFSPAEISVALNDEASWVMRRVADAAMARGHSIAYQMTMQDVPDTRDLLRLFKEKGYSQRIALSVEEPLQVAIDQNRDRWEAGYLEFKEKKEAGELIFGNPLTKESIIKSAYKRSEAQSDCRKNVDRLAREEWITDVIEVDQGEKKVLNQAALEARWGMQAAAEYEYAQLAAQYGLEAAHLEYARTNEYRSDSPPPPYADIAHEGGPTESTANAQTAQFAAMSPSTNPPGPGAGAPPPPGPSRLSRLFGPRGQTGGRRGP
ncbi:zeta toxin family protein [Streptomyces sp. NPDC048277]|uniref:zeta toxin family protein n=1 Tax=Streptomyces sp. NPDC048277 TaxID=3155027 RepID=UPI00340DFCB0